MVSVAYSALLCLSFSASTNAQQIDYTTGNLISGPWTGAPSSTTNPGGLSGGYQPTFNTNTNTIQFGYNTGTASQTIAINSALANAGTGVQINGYTYSWDYYNTNMSRGTLNGQIRIAGPSGNVLESYNYAMPQNSAGWVHQQGTQAFTNPYTTATASYLGIAFTGKDDRWWAGYYGPLVKAVDLRLNYSVDPCATNPAYSPTCAGFKDVLTSTNLVPNPTAYAYDGWSMDQSYAINTALASAGSNAMIHGFKWGYVANANGTRCTAWFLVCFDYVTPTITTDVNITSSTGASLYSVSRTYTNSYNTTDYSYLFPASKPMNTLGNFNFTATTNDQQAYIGSVWSKAIYTVDPCVNNPLYSPSCPGYGAAIAGKTSTTTTTTYTAPTTTTSTTAVASSDPTVSAPTTTNVGGVELSSSGTISTPDGVPQVVKDSQPVTASSSSTTTTPTASSGGSKPNMSLVMNAVKAVQEQNKANETRAVANAQAVVASSTAQSQETAATVIANIATANAISAQQSSQVNTQQQASSSLGLTLNKPNSQGISVFGNVNSSMTVASIQAGSQIYYRLETRNNNNETQVLLPQTSTGSRTDPLAMMMQQGNLLEQTNIEQRNETVKKNVQPNEAAAGVDLTAMAVVPAGFNSYSLIMRDAAFYAPREVYKNQKIVDNTRVLRQMSSDKLHQDMVDSQYKKGE